MLVILQRNQKRATNEDRQSRATNKLEDSSNHNRGNLQTTGRPLTARGRNAIVLVAAALAVSVLMTWPLAVGHGPPRTHPELWRRTLRGVERRVGRACAHHQPGRSLRRQHLLSASTRARLLRGQHRRRARSPCRSGQPRAILSRRTTQSCSDGVCRVGRLHVAPRPSADWRRRRRRSRVDPVRVLPVRLRPHRPHPAADGRGHSAQPARLSSPGRCAVVRSAAWRSVSRSRRKRCRARITASRPA